MGKREGGKYVYTSLYIYLVVEAGGGGRVPIVNLVTHRSLSFLLRIHLHPPIQHLRSVL